MNLLRKRVACSSPYDDSTWPSSSSSVACVHLRYAFASELNFFNVLCSPWSKVKWIPCGSSDRLVKMVSETLASNCTACMCEGLSESINNRIFWLPCQNHNGVSRAIYSAIKVKCFSQSLWTPSGQWSHRHGEITQYAIPLTEDNARNCISYSFFWVCERNRNGDNPSLFTGKWWKQKRFYFQFSSIVFQPLQASKVNGSQSAINVKHTKRADKKCECSEEVERSVVVGRWLRRFGICVNPFPFAFIYDCVDRNFVCCVLPILPFAFMYRRYTYTNGILAFVRRARILRKKTHIETERKKKELSETR